MCSFIYADHDGLNVDHALWYVSLLQWYVDVALALLERAGDFCSDDIWHRVVQLVTNNDNMQAYAARSVVDVLGRGAAHESLMATAAYILGEYGKLIKVRIVIISRPYLVIVAHHS